MSKGIFLGDGDGRVDRTARGEKIRRSAGLSDGEEVFVHGADTTPKSAPRPSRAVDQGPVDVGFMRALKHLLETGDYTPEELRMIFSVSRATIYRRIDELQMLREQYKLLKMLDEESLDDYHYASRIGFRLDELVDLDE